MKVYKKIQTMELDEMTRFLNLLSSADPADIYCRYMCIHKVDKYGECKFDDCIHVDDLREVLNAEYDFVMEKIQEEVTQ